MVNLKSWYCSGQVYVFPQNCDIIDSFFCKMAEFHFETLWIFNENDKTNLDELSEN